MVLGDFLELRAPIIAMLGYVIGGVLTVTVPSDPSRYYVRFSDGSFAQAMHRGRVMPVPDLPVEIGTDKGGNLVILAGVDYDCRNL